MPFAILIFENDFEEACACALGCVCKSERDVRFWVKKCNQAVKTDCAILYDLLVNFPAF